MANLDALKEALAKMTPGKWYASGRKLYQHNGPSGPIAELFGYQQAHDDAAGIVMLRNSAEAMIARIEALEAENARLREAGNRLAFMAETSGGVAGRDDALVSAIEEWAKAKAVNRILRFEGDGVSVSAGRLDHPLRAALKGEK